MTSDYCEYLDQQFMICSPGTVHSGLNLVEHERLLLYLATLPSSLLIERGLEALFEHNNIYREFT